jgi:serine/threonine protein kinase
MSDDPNIGRVLGSYRLVSLLAEGGMSNIYVGSHTRLNRYAAIKILKPALQARRDAVVRFFAEARTVHRLAHPNIIASLDLVEDADASYCVLELLQGPSLERRLAESRLPLGAVIRIGAQFADALHAVHAQGIVHRDLKPANLIVLERDVVKLIDFGVAQLGDDDAGGAAYGTPAYMAPEQAAGERVDGRADVYALGVLLYEMATGRHPFPSSTDSEYVLRHADERPVVPSRLDAHVPPALDKLILRCLAKDPADRPDAAAVATALRALESPIKRRRIAPLVLAGVAAIASASVVVALVLRGDDKPAPAPVVVTVPPPKPAPPPPPVKQTVTLSFASLPSGARVFRPGETIALGVTPFQTTLPIGTATAVRFELAGYDTLEVLASLDDDDTIEVTLAKQAPIVRPRPPEKKPPPLQREGTIDPFKR